MTTCSCLCALGLSGLLSTVIDHCSMYFPVGSGVLGPFLLLAYTYEPHVARLAGISEA